MIELDVIHDGKLRQIVHELWALIEIRGVVFITLDDEVFAVGDSKTGAKILHYAPDQESWIELALIHHPGSDTRSCCLSVRPSHNERSPATNEFLLHDLCLRSIKQFPIECFF